MMETILRGKTREEITYEFRRKHNIPETDWKSYNKEMKKIKLPELSRHIVLLWAIPLAMFGLTLLLSLAAAGMGFGDTNTFPRIFKVESPTFYQRMVNVGEGIFLITTSVLLIIFSIKALVKTYDK
jgi:hypothetical protein